MRGLRIPPRPPFPVRHANEDMASKFHAQYARYYRFHYNEDGTPKDRKALLLYAAVGAGAALGCALGVNESVHSKYDDERRFVYPVIGTVLGGLGGAVLPVGLLWLFLYADHKLDFFQ